MGVTVLSPGMQVAQYRLEQCLGAGAFGEVWRTSDGLRPVAIKFINANLLTDSAAELHLERLRSEIHALQYLATYRHIPDLYGYDLACERPYLVMQYIDKPALSKLIMSGEILCVTLKQRLELLQIISQTIRAVHVAGLLHRDIKPSNIHGINHPYLLDFSVALDKRLAGQTNRRVGTKLYMAPDDGRPPDERDDNYSFALVAYEVLFGRHPFVSPDDSDEEAWPPSPDWLAAGRWGMPGRLTGDLLPRALHGADLQRLDAIFLKALGERDGRYDYPTIFVRDLEEAILIPANEQYLDYVPDVATSLSLQFSMEEDFTEDQVTRAAHGTDHGIHVRTRPAAIHWRYFMVAPLLVAMIAVLLAVILAR